jgi:hypothetical protein
MTAASNRIAGKRTTGAAQSAKMSNGERATGARNLTLVQATSTGEFRQNVYPLPEDLNAKKLM